MKKNSKSTSSSTHASTKSGAKSKTSSTSRSPKSSSAAAKKRTGLTPKTNTKKTTRVSENKKKTSASAKLNSTPSKTKKKSTTSHDPIILPEENKKLPKTHLTAKELRGFKALLLAKRSELAGDVERLTDEALKRTTNGADEHSSMPIHMADAGSDNWEQDFTLGLIASEEAVVHEIDDALERIQNKTYGVCIVTHNPISHARLEAKPWAKFCIEYARAKEEGRAP